MSNNISNSLFVSLEGGEGSGKTTQAHMIKTWLEEKGYQVILTKQPGGANGVCEQLRHIVLSQNFRKVPFSSVAELFIFFADRAQHIHQVILPNLDQGKIVICDRFGDSTYAYQVIARQVCTNEQFLYLTQLATGGLMPDHTFWYDLDPKIALARLTGDREINALDLEGIEFHKNVRKGFQTLFSQRDKNLWTCIDGTKSEEEIFSAKIPVLQKLLQKIQ